MNRTSVMMRGHALLGLASCAVLFLLITAGHVFGPYVDPWTDPVSNLALGQAKLLAAIAFGLGGLGCFALAIAIWHAQSSPSWQATTCMALGSVCIGLLSLFPTDGGVVPQTTASRIHAVAALFGFSLVQASLLLHGRHFARSTRWRPVHRLLQTLAYASLAFLAATGVLSLGSMVAGRFLPFTGLAERLVVAAMLSWTMVASIRLYKLGKSAAS